MMGMIIKEGLQRAPDGFAVEGSAKANKDQNANTIFEADNRTNGVDATAGYSARSASSQAIYGALPSNFTGATLLGGLLGHFASRIALMTFSGDGLDFATFGDIRFYTGSLISSAEAMRILANKNVGIGTPDQFGGGAGVIGLANAGTNPSSNPTNAIVLWADGGELKVRDSSGNVTTLSPHPEEEMNATDPDKEPLPGFYYSINPTLGKMVVINLTKMADLLQAQFPDPEDQFIKYVDIDKVDPAEAEKEAWKAAWKEKNVTEIVISKAEALEEYEEKKVTILPTFTVKRVLDEKTGEVKPVTMNDRQIDTQTLYRLKEGVRLDDNTGAFLKTEYPTDAEAEAAAAKEFTATEQPPWIKDRLTAVQAEMIEK